ncbi:MAG: EamA family transporter [Bacteroidales bacterium]|nr:EamA family transporter [Bacteroidales bacterium]
MKHGNLIAGYLLGAAAAASYGLNPSFALPLYAAGLNPDSVLLLRYGLAILMVAVMIALKGGSFKVPLRSLLPLLCLGLLMSASSLTLFESYNHMAAGIASTMLFVYPLMVALIGTLFCKERIKMVTVLCLFAATAGIALLYKQEGGGTLSFVGTLLVMLSALSYAIYLVAVGGKAVRNIPSLTLTFYVLIFGSLLFVGRMALGGIGFTSPHSVALWADAAALALFPTVISLICTARAIQIIGSTQTAILGALEPITAVVMGMMFFHETLSLRECLGIVMIISAVSVVVARATRA